MRLRRVDSGGSRVTGSNSRFGSWSSTLSNHQDGVGGPDLHQLEPTEQLAAFGPAARVSGVARSSGALV